MDGSKKEDNQNANFQGETGNIHTGAKSAPDLQNLSWDASEYVQSSKSFLWVLMLIIVFLALAGVAFLLKAWTFLVLIVLMGITMGIFAFRQPRTLHYQLTAQGIEINKKLFTYSNFRYFSIVPDGGFFILVLAPIKQYGLSLNVYLPPTDGDKIANEIGNHLPLKNVKPDLLDAIARRLHF